MTTDNFTTAESGPGWYEFIMPGGSTTHIAYAYEDGSVYLPEGPDVVDEVDFRLAASSARFWKLERAAQEPTDAEHAAQFAVESKHQFHGSQCLCGFETERARTRTEHIMTHYFDEVHTARAARRDEEKDR